MAKRLYLYLISQDINLGYDTFRSAVVCAEDEEKARRINPGDPDNQGFYSGTWAAPEYVTVEKIGIADEGQSEGVILAHFRAG